MASLAKLLKKQKCLSDHILSLLPQHTGSEESAEISFGILCKFEQLLRSNFKQIEQLSSVIGHESRIKEYRRLEENLHYLKSICEGYLQFFAQFRLTFQRGTVVFQQFEVKKQICLLNTVVKMEPVNAVNDEEIELYKDVLDHICQKFDQIQCGIESYLSSEDYDSQLKLIEQFDEIVKCKKSILDGNIALLRNLDSMCS